MESFDGTAANRILQSDAKTFSSSVEVNTAQLERYLCTIQETLAKHEDSFKLVPLLARKLDLCILDVDVIRDKFYQQEATGIEKYLQVGLTVAHCLSVNLQLPISLYINHYSWSLVVEVIFLWIYSSRYPFCEITNSIVVTNDLLVSRIMCHSRCCHSHYLKFYCCDHLPYFFNRDCYYCW